MDRWRANNDNHYYSISSNSSPKLKQYQSLESDSSIQYGDSKHGIYILFTVWWKQVPFSMARENVELIQECCPQHLQMRAATIMLGKGTEEKSMQKR